MVWLLIVLFVCFFKACFNVIFILCFFFFFSALRAWRFGCVDQKWAKFNTTISKQVCSFDMTHATVKKCTHVSHETKKTHEHWFLCSLFFFFYFFNLSWQREGGRRYHRGVFRKSALCWLRRLGKLTCTRNHVKGVMKRTLCFFFCFFFVLVF